MQHSLCLLSPRLALSVLLALLFKSTAGLRPYTLSLHDALPICLAFGTGDNAATVLAASGEVTEIPRAPKEVLADRRSEEHTSELQSHSDLVCRLLLEKKNLWNPSKRREVIPDIPRATLAGLTAS